MYSFSFRTKFKPRFQSRDGNRLRKCVDRLVSRCCDVPCRQFWWERRQKGPPPRHLRRCRRWSLFRNWTATEFRNEVRSTFRYVSMCPAPHRWNATLAISASSCRYEDVPLMPTDDCHIVPRRHPPTVYFATLITRVRAFTTTLGLGSSRQRIPLGVRERSAKSREARVETR